MLRYRGLGAHWLRIGGISLIFVGLISALAWFGHDMGNSQSEGLFTFGHDTVLSVEHKSHNPSERRMLAAMILDQEARAEPGTNTTAYHLTKQWKIILERMAATGESPSAVPARFNSGSQPVQLIIRLLMTWWALCSMGITRLTMREEPQWTRGRWRKPSMWLLVLVTLPGLPWYLPQGLGKRVYNKETLQKLVRAAFNMNHDQEAALRAYTWTLREMGLKNTPRTELDAIAALPGVVGVDQNGLRLRVSAFAACNSKPEDAMAVQITLRILRATKELFFHIERVNGEFDTRTLTQIELWEGKGLCAVFLYEDRVVEAFASLLAILYGDLAGINDKTSLVYDPAVLGSRRWSLLTRALANMSPDRA